MTASPEKAAPIPADGLVDAVAKAISSHGYTEQVKGDGFAWWWNSLHDHPGNVFAHECREEDRAKARLALQVIMQDLANREVCPSLPDSREERIREAERDRLYGEAEMQHAAALLRNDIIAGEFHANAASWLKEAGNGAMLPADRARARQGGNNG